MQTLDARVELNLLEVLAKSYGEGFVKAVEGMEAKPQIKKDDSRLLKEDVARMTRPIQDYNRALAGKVDEIVRDSFAAGKDDMEVARILRARIPEILNNEPITIQRPGKRPVSFTADEYADIVANVVPYAVRNEGYIRGLKEAGADGWQSVAVGDERMCPMCGEKHGQVYGWEDPKPPYHPKCRCRPVAYFKPMTKEEIAESERIKAWAEEKPWEGSTKPEVDLPDHVKPVPLEKRAPSGLAQIDELSKSVDSSIYKEFTKEADKVNKRLFGENVPRKLTPDNPKIKTRLAGYNQWVEDPKRTSGKSDEIILSASLFTKTDYSTDIAYFKKHGQYYTLTGKIGVEKGNPIEAAASMYAHESGHRLSALYNQVTGNVKNPYNAVDVAWPNQKFLDAVDAAKKEGWKIPTGYSKSTPELFSEYVSAMFYAPELTHPKIDDVIEEMIDVITGGSGITSSKVADKLIDDILPAKMAYPGSKIERPKLERKTIDIHNSPVINKAVADEIAYMNGGAFPSVSGKGDIRLKNLAEEIGFSEMPTIVTEAELDKIVAEGHRELWRGLNQNKPGEFTNLFRSGEYFAGEGIYGNGIYTGTGEGARNLAALYAPGEHGAVMRMAIDKDAKVITVTELKEKLDAELKSLKFDRSSEEAWAASKVKKEFMQDPGRAAVVWGYDAIDVENGQFIVLNRKAIYVQATDYTREDRSKW